MQTATAAPRREQQLDPNRPRRLGGDSRHEHIVPHVLAEGGHLRRRQGADGDGSTGGSAVASCPVDPLDRALAAITVPHPLGETHAPLGAAESVTGSRAEVVDDVLTLTQLHGGLVGDFTNPPEVGIQLADASLYAADGLWKPEGVPGSRRQRAGPFL